jgi:hypothetical protein
MIGAEDKICLIHEHRTMLLIRMFDEGAGRSVARLADDIAAAAKIIHKRLSHCDEIQSLPRGLFILALKQVMDSFIAGLLTGVSMRFVHAAGHLGRSAHAWALNAPSRSPS